jgi:hypothetical protein
MGKYRREHKYVLEGDDEWPGALSMVGKLNPPLIIAGGDASSWRTG